MLNKAKTMLKNMLYKCGLALEKDYSYADYMWVNTLNHISYHLLNEKTSMPVLKNLAELLIMVDVDGEELINDWLKDWKSNNIDKVYKARLNVICPIIIKAQKKLKKELEEWEDKTNANN